MSMITDSLTCCPQKSPAGAGRRCRSWCHASWPAPAIHAAQHERAGRAGNVSQRGRLYRWSAVSPRQPVAPAILHGLARRTAPQTQGAAPGAAHKKGPRAKPGPVGSDLVVIHCRRIWWGCQSRRRRISCGLPSRSTLPQEAPAKPRRYRRTARRSEGGARLQCAMKTGNSAAARIFEVAPPKII